MLILLQINSHLGFAYAEYDLQFKMKRIKHIWTARLINFELLHLNMIKHEVESYKMFDAWN